jgi:hypothetical protein
MPQNHEKLKLDKQKKKPMFVPGSIPVLSGLSFAHFPALF